MDIKFGKIKPNSNFFTELPEESSVSPDANFFTQQSNFDFKDERRNQPFQGQRLNDLDSNILENNAYQEMPDEMFKLEHKIGMLEASLTKIDNEIKTLESFGYGIQVFELKNRRIKIKEELDNLNKRYSSFGLGSKISGHIASAVNSTKNQKLNSVNNVKTFLSKKVLAKVSKKFDYSQKIKEALESLSDINLSVDELIQMQTPYGESINRYEKLTAYLNKANVIHSKITLNIDDLAKKKLR